MSAINSMGYLVADRHMMGLSDAEILSEWENPGLGKSLKRRVRSAVKSVKKVAPYVLAPVTAGASLLMTEKGKKIAKNIVLPVVAQVVVPIVGGVLAPFTGGASLVAASAISTGYKVYETKEKSKLAIKKGEKQVAYQAAQEEQAANSEFDRQAQAIYDQARDTHFIPMGYTPSVWGSLTRDQKLKVIEGLQNGTAQPYSSSAIVQQPPTVKVPADLPAAPAPSPGPVSWAYRPPSSGGGLSVSTFDAGGDGVPQEVSVDRERSSGGQGWVVPAMILLGFLAFSKR